MTPTSRATPIRAAYDRFTLLNRSAVIRAPHLVAALALWDYAERSVYYIFGDELGAPLADELLKVLRGCPAGLTRNDLGDLQAPDVGDASGGEDGRRIGRAGQGRADINQGVGSLAWGGRGWCYFGAARKNRPA